MSGFIDRLRRISNDATLSPAQKSRYLALEAEGQMPYPALDPSTQQALADRVICDMFEGHAPYRPRYVLPDYSVVLTKGSAYLELPAPQSLDEAINTLQIAYHHVPSITGMPVYIGQLDELLLPFLGGVSDEDLRRKLVFFWRYLDRTLPDAFMHANIGPTDNRVSRMILDVDAELGQAVPNLTLLYDPAVSTEAILSLAIDSILRCSKPHIANHPLHASAFDARGYGIVSCYNSLPLAGGASSLTRLNLNEVAQRSTGEASFLNDVLPFYVERSLRLLQARTDYLFEESGFFESFLVEEGWIEKDRFTGMFGVFAMAEAVDTLQEKEGRQGKYGHDEAANELGYRISKLLRDAVAARSMRHLWRGRALLHSQAGISSDSGLTPGVRIPYGTEPDPIEHVRALAPHHQYYDSGISEILTLEETVKGNPEALRDLCKGALASGFREFTANVEGNDLVRVTGYMIRLADVRRFSEEGSRTNTTVLGSEAIEITGILNRRPRVVGHELHPSYDQ